MYDTVLAALRRGAADEALVAARELLVEQPADITALRLLAAAQRLSGDADSALTTLDSALELAPEDADLHLERAGLLLQARDLDRAQVALARSVGLDPNQFPAYIIQAQLALGRGELDEAERLVRTAARIAPEHPQLLAVEGMVALRRGRPDHALELLSAAARTAPEEPMVRHALGFAYLAKGHLAFAEQAFRGLLQTQPGNAPLQALIADVVRQQGRPAHAADELAPLLEDPATGPAMHRLVGELELEADRAAAALPRLKHALALLPGDRRTLSALLGAWQRLEDPDDARSTLDAALATHSGEPDLWLARLGIEPFASAEALAVIDRWLLAMPDHIPALVARMTTLDASGDADAAERAAQRVVEVEPGHGQGEMRLLGGLLAREPEQAVRRIGELMAKAQDPAVRTALRQLLGIAQDRAGRPAEAVSTWLALHQEGAESRQPPTPSTRFSGPWPDASATPGAGPSALLLWGAPGSHVERVAQTFGLGGAPLLHDRFGANPPADPLQRQDTPRALVDGSLDAAYLIGQWRAGLPGRGAVEARAFDWLPYWDNALLLSLRQHLPEALLLIALRDPRDMLLDWIVFGSPAPLRLEQPLDAANWLVGVLDDIADLQSQQLFAHRILKLDGVSEDPAGVAQVLADALQMQVPVPPREAFGAVRFPSGDWRRFEPVLGDAFAVLAPVAARLGYTD